MEESSRRVFEPSSHLSVGENAGQSTGGLALINVGHACAVRRVAFSFIVAFVDVRHYLCECRSQRLAE